MFRILNRHLSNMSKKAQKSKTASKVKPVETQTVVSPITLDPKTKDVLISIHAKPGAKQNNITGITDEGVGVQINAPPAEGEANAELVRYMASVLGLSKSKVNFEKGFKSRSKTLRVTGDLSVEEVTAKITKEISLT